MSAIGIDNAKNREINEATQWLVSRQLAGLLQEPQAFPAPSFGMQMAVAESMANRLQEIEVPPGFAHNWRLGFKQMADLACELRMAAEWLGDGRGC